MLSYINLLLIIVLTITLMVGFYLIKNKYEEDISEHDETLIKIFDKLNKNDEYLNKNSASSKEEIQAIITKNSNDLGENRGLIMDNVGLVDALVTKLDTKNSNVTTTTTTTENDNTSDNVVEGYQDLTAKEIRDKQATTLQNIIGMKLPTSLQNNTTTNQQNTNANQSLGENNTDLLPPSDDPGVGDVALVPGAEIDESSSTPAEDSSTPAGGSSTPAGDSSTPAGDSSTPAGDSSTPAEDSSTPAETDFEVAVISGYQNISDTKRCEFKNNSQINDVNNLSKAQDCADACTLSNNCKNFSFEPSTKYCLLYNNNCDLIDGSTTWHTYNKFEPFIPFMYNQRGVSTATESVFKPLIAK
jgi:hypothetical protein